MFTDDVTEDRNTGMNCEVHRDIPSAHIHPDSAKVIGPRFTVQMTINIL